MTELFLIFLLIGNQSLFCQEFALKNTLFIPICEQLLFVINDIADPLHLILHSNILFFKLIKFFILEGYALNHQFVRDDILLVGEREGTGHLECLLVIGVHVIK